MGWFDNFSKKMAIKKLAKEILKFNQVRHYMEVMLYKDIIEKLNKIMPQTELGSIKFLSAQIVNYYNTYDIKSIIEKLDEPEKSEVLKIKDLIISTANDLLKIDYYLRKLIIYSLRTDNVFQFALRGEEYIHSDEKKRKEDILTKYGEEFPEETTPIMFYKIVSDYFKVNV